MTDYGAGRETQRPGSIRSVASNSSIGSGVSLTRRSRTRKRSKTVTGVSPQPVEGAVDVPKPILPRLQVDYMYEPISAYSPNSDLPYNMPPRPTPSPQTSSFDVSDGGGNDLRDHNFASTSRAATEPRIDRPLTKMTSQTSGMQILPTAAEPHPRPSAFSRDPDLTGVGPSAGNIRDSLSTQASSLSSSVYPPSTETTSGPDFPSHPHSMADDEDNCEAQSCEPQVEETREFDSDDVSYRLRLLVNNNYFLPPAHSKPAVATFSTSGAGATKKPPTPTFFDRFRGKSRSKPPTPTGPSPGFDPSGLTLRTAADSITTSHLLRPQQPRNSSQIPRSPTGTRTGRVAVVREKMQDLAVAAKQAEQDMKTRAAKGEHSSQASPTTFDEVIDPTDTVDIPLPGANYPFAVQASALHGLGVQDSVGAALLADRLPPPRSPGMSSLDPEDHWRKMLLHQAVHHSLDSTSPDTSMTGGPSPLSLRPRLPARGASLPTRPLLDQRILLNPMFSDTSPPAISRKQSSQSVASAPSKTQTASFETSMSSQILPLRSSTPAGPLTPLSPAPRRHWADPSLSTLPAEAPKPELHGKASDLGHGKTSEGQRTVSALVPADAYEEMNTSETLPPLPTPTVSTTSFAEIQEGRISSTSYYTDHDTVDDNRVPRASIAFSAFDGRPSLSPSEYSQASPTMSAFRDAPSSFEQADQSSERSRWQRTASHDTPPNRDILAPRYSAMSPPPRMSSSLAHIALSPPPRLSSFNYQSHDPQTTIHSLVSRHDTNSHSSTPPLTDDNTLIINAPEPTTPPFPASRLIESTPRRQLSLDIPPSNPSVTVHPSPGPSSTTSFFDSIQFQPNAMDDLESSDESSDENAPRLNAPSPIRPDPRSRSLSITPATPRPVLTRFGNHSTPYVGQAAEKFHSSTGYKGKQPVGNVPARVPFFADRAGRSDQGHGSPVSSFDFYKYAQKSREDLHDNSGNGRRSADGPVLLISNMKSQASLRDLDGMMAKHIEAEKDTIKRIATTARSNIPLDR